MPIVTLASGTTTLNGSSGLIAINSAYPTVVSFNVPGSVQRQLYGHCNITSGFLPGLPSIPVQFRFVSLWMPYTLLDVPVGLQNPRIIIDWKKKDIGWAILSIQ